MEITLVLDVWSLALCTCLWYLALDFPSWGSLSGYSCHLYRLSDSVAFLALRLLMVLLPVEYVSYAEHLIWLCCPQVWARSKLRSLETKTSLSVLDSSVGACTVPLKTQKIFWLLLFCFILWSFRTVELMLLDAPSLKPSGCQLFALWAYKLFGGNCTC